MDTLLEHRPTVFKPVTINVWPAAGLLEFGESNGAKLLYDIRVVVTNKISLFGPPNVIPLTVGAGILIVSTIFPFLQINVII